MNTLVQTETGLLGSSQTVQQLSQSESSRLLVISDTHGHYDVFESIVKVYGSQCNALVFSGDGMWDVIQYLEKSQENTDLMRSLPPVIAFVSGNGDGDQYRINLSSESLENSPLKVPGLSLMVPGRQILHASGHSLLIVHGHRYSVDVSLEVLVASAHSLNCDIAIYGHTHIPFAQSFHHVFAMNPGSPTRPRGKASASFAILSLNSTTKNPVPEFYAVKKRITGSFYFESISV